MKTGKQHISISSKGGSGKTTTLLQLVVSYINKKTNKPVKVISADDNNITQTAVDSDIFKIQNLNVQDGIDEAMKSLFEVLSGEDIAIDVGGGNDTFKMIDSLSNLGMSNNHIFYIPVTKDKSNIKNLRDTYNAIRNTMGSEIVMVLNKAKSSEIDEVKKEFKYFFGDDNLKIKGFFEEVYNDKNLKIVILKDTDVFDIADDFGKTAYEIAKEDIVVSEHIQKAQSESYEAFIEALTYTKIYTLCKTYSEEVLEDAFKELDKTKEQI